jgi:hypothetical protein
MSIASVPSSAWLKLANRSSSSACTVSSTARAIFVGNNWEGTTDIVDPSTFQRLKRINVVPDREERMAEIQRNPVRLAFFLAIREFIGEGHDQLNDDVFTRTTGALCTSRGPASPTS